MLFDDDRTFELTADEWAVVSRPVNGDGGAQSLLRSVLRSEVRPRTLVLSDQVLNRLHAYGYRYGGGGFQDRFRTVLDAARRAGWKPPPGDIPPHGPGIQFGAKR